MIRYKYLYGIFSLIILFVSMNAPSVHATGYWVVDDYATEYHNYDLLTNALRTTHDNDNSLSRVSIDEPMKIHLKSLTNLQHRKSYVYFIYDMGHGDGPGERLGYENVDDFTTYRVKIDWTLDGTFVSNDNAGTYLKVKYETYYMSGSDKIILTSIWYTLGDSATGSKNFNNLDITHTLTGYDAVQNEELYLQITFIASSQFNWNYPTTVAGTNFYNSHLLLSLRAVTYEHYVDTSGGGGGIH